MMGLMTVRLTRWLLPATSIIAVALAGRDRAAARRDPRDAPRPPALSAAGQRAPATADEALRVVDKLLEQRAGGHREPSSRIHRSSDSLQSCKMKLRTRAGKDTMRTAAT